MVRFPFVLAETLGAHGLPIVAYVTRGSPAVGELREYGGVGKRHVIRKAENNVATARAQRIAHFARFRLFIWVPVVLQIVNSPLSPLPRVVRGEMIFSDGPGQDLFVDAAPFGNGWSAPGPF